jgi:hypothetical protein
MGATSRGLVARDAETEGENIIGVDPKLRNNCAFATMGESTEPPLLSTSYCWGTRAVVVRSAESPNCLLRELQL